VSTQAVGDWMSILSRANSSVLNSKRWRRDLTPEMLSIGWCGQPPATENEIVETEQRLGLKLPPSYRSFLSISNGWRPFPIIEWLLPVQEIERFRIAEPEDLALIQECFPERDTPDEAYLDYETPKNVEALRPRYFPDCLLVGRRWERSGGELFLLNPHIAFPDGEWEAIFFANWIPGNTRFRSFCDLIKDTIGDDEEIRG
jgi:hypothetical protein